MDAPSTDDVASSLRVGALAHRRGDVALAERCYRAALSKGPHPGASVLLANALLSRSGADAGVRAEALAHARDGLAGVERRPVAEAVRLWSRFAYFLLSYTGHMLSGADGGGSGCTDAGGVGSGVDGGAVRSVAGGGGSGSGTDRSTASALLAPTERAALLGEAIAALERVVALDAAHALSWRNLCIAYTAAGRLGDAERAAARACATTPPGSGAWDAHYKHGKALKRLGREADALAKYADALEAAVAAGDAPGAREAQALPLFWLRVAEAGEGGGVGGGGGAGGEGAAGVGGASGALPPGLRARVRALLAEHDARGGGAAPPPEYVRRLFDGYAATFEQHLVGALHYATPGALLALALRAAHGRGAWAHAADAGCGTGLAGAALRPHCERVSGCDLAPRMVAEARARGVYDDAEAGDAVQWLLRAGGSGAGAPPPVDLVVAADVLVYLGDLRPFFAATGAALARGAAEVRGVDTAGRRRPPPLALVSTEALLPAAGGGAEALSDAEEAALCGSAGFLLTRTGRCAHSRVHVRTAAAAGGLAVRSVTRAQLRLNAGVPVMGDLWVLARAAAAPEAD